MLLDMVPRNVSHSENNKTCVNHGGTVQKYSDSINKILRLKSVKKETQLKHYNPQRYNMTSWF